MGIMPLLAADSALSLGGFLSDVGRSASSGAASFFDQLAGNSAKTTPNAPASPSSPDAPSVDGLTSSPAKPDAAGIVQHRDAALAAFQARLKMLLAQKGIDVGNGFHLRLDPLGTIRVAGDHPAKAEIEATIAGDDQLQDLFRSIAADSRMIAASAASDGNANALAEGGIVDLSIGPNGIQPGLTPPTA